jgi:glycosyltransferase involved in cell wall biosynthesis
MDVLIKPLVGLFISNLGGGGVQRVVLNLAAGLIAEGIEVDLVVGWAEGINKEYIPIGVQLINLNKKNILACLPGLIRYLQKRLPSALVTAQTHVNIVGIASKFLYGKKIRLVVCEHNNMKEVVKANPNEWYRPVFARWFYPKADVIVAVSNGVADGLAEMTDLPRERIKVIHNPVISEIILKKAKEPIMHPWFQDTNTKVMVTVGRLENQKDLSTLINALKVINGILPLRLIILGEGSQREHLQSLIDKLGLHEIVDMPGFVENPYTYMKHASVFVLSSKYEGFPGVLVEALAVGVPVVSTDCPSGPAEILGNGRYGRMVPVGDVNEMAFAIKETLDNPIPTEVSIKRGMEFNIKNITKEYMKILFLKGKMAG